MEGIEGLGVLYLGRPYDLATGTAADTPLLYDSKDLVTHAVCVGMTGSGKTGLCLALLEEAVLDGVPAVIVDPKGDLADLLLAFPDLAPADFQPWVNADDAAQQGITVEQLAANEAKKWSDGLAGSGQDGARVGRLKAAADFAIYTPGSDAGLPVSVLGALSPPASTDSETLRDAISSTVSGILGLLGIDADPVRSREHILLSTLLSTAWAAGQSLSLASLIGHVQTPPMQTIGVLDIESFFPTKDRFGLAMQINNLLAAPGFDLWMKGEPLDAQRLLVAPDGRPRVSIFSIAHLSDPERMFFVTLLSNAMVAWMRAQPGTTSLRALYYMDEIFGFFPPVAEPPSKKPLLTLLKQARAAGLGVVLATQNPADLDYKGLSNAGTWFIGRLQAQRDKERLLDGLEGAATGQTFDRAALDQTISGLAKRVFLMNNVHETHPVAFQSRFALSYLAGPITRDGIRRLMAGRAPAAAATAPVVVAGAGSAPTPVAVAPAATPAAAAPVVAPPIPPDVPRSYIPTRGTRPDGATLVYVPQLIGAAIVILAGAPSELCVLTAIGDGAVPVTWDTATDAGVSSGDLGTTPEDGAEFAPTPAVATSKRSYAAWQKDFADWIYRSQGATVFTAERFRLSSSPGESEGDFRARLAVTAREQRDEAAAKLRARYGPKEATLQERIRKAQAAVAREKEQANTAKLQTAISLGTSILGAFLGRKNVASSTGTVLRGVTRSMDQSGDVGRAGETVEALSAQLAALQGEFTAEAATLDAGFDPAAEPLTSRTAGPRKSDIDVRLVALAYAPHWRDATGIVTPGWR
jgi:hypothetical protein